MCRPEAGLLNREKTWKGDTYNDSHQGQDSGVDDEVLDYHASAIWGPSDQQYGRLTPSKAVALV